MNRALPLACALVLVASWAATAGADAPVGAAGSPLARVMIGGAEVPELILAQRAIDRMWGPSEDSIYVETHVPEWRSEGLAMALSAAVPGAGQTYVGGWSGAWFALAEIAGWTARTLIRNRAGELKDEAITFLGAPGDSASAWSFERWSKATNRDTEELRRLYAADRDAFFRRIGLDEALLAGWRGDAVTTRSSFEELRERSDVQYGRARMAGMALWINHIAATVDALRAARLHNVPLEKNLELKIRSSWHSNGPGVMAILEKRF